MIHRNHSPVLPSLLVWACALWIPVITGCDRPVITSTPSAHAGTADNPAPVTVPPSASASQAPLLLEDEARPLPDEGEGNHASDTPGADNSRCFVCHVNYMDEKLATTHARAKIACADCHGASDAHIADESWASGGNGTAPGIMYPREKINSSCMTCHAREKIDTSQHQAVLANPAEKVCTDCHGRHRLPQRRCKWK
jgi:hypothetical protein